MSFVRPGRRFPIPAFLAEIEGPEYRARLEFSVRSGLTIVLAFLLFGLLEGAIQREPLFFWPVGLKLLTNTVAWLALRAKRVVLPTTSVNVFVDVVVMTWAIYMTGAALSPLFCIYAIELTVVALLSNVGTTVLISGIAIAQYLTMIALVQAGVLEQTAPLAITPSDLTPRYLLFLTSFFPFVLAVPTLFTAAILGQLREKQRALEERTQALVDASRERAQFMANITHELRTPIHGIRGLSELVTTGVYGPLADPRQHKAHETIMRSAESLLSLVDDLLELARADAGRLTFDPVDVDVAELCDRLIATTRGLVGTRSLTFTAEIGESLPPAYTDRAKLTQIVLNLLANAVKFTPDGGVVTLRVSAREGLLVFEVSDTGPGIPGSELTRIFEAFVQVDGSKEREHGGVGLGLTLVKRLCSLLGAEVIVESTPGRGTTFTVELPTSPRATLEPASAHSMVADLA